MTFLRNHVGVVSFDFFTVPTIPLRMLYVLVVLAHELRRILHFNVTERPTAVWAAQQIVQAFPESTAPGYLVRDRDGVYGSHFRTRVQGMGIQEVLTAAQSPWQNPFAERLIGSIRRECLNHVIVLGERHLRWTLKIHPVLSRFANGSVVGKRFTRFTIRKSVGEIIAIPHVGGLHHRYERRVA
jgi:hypothetical protein